MLIMNRQIVLFYQKSNARIRIFIQQQYKTAAKSAGWLAQDIQWKDVIVQNSRIIRQDWHGIIANPTFARGRLITINGIAYGFNKTDRGTRVAAIENIFQLETFPVQGGNFYNFDFTDDDGVAKRISAKVYTKPEYSNGQGDPFINFRVELLAQDPIIKSQTPVTASGDYGIYGGLLLETTLPEAMDESSGSFSATNAGTFASPVEITITGEIINPKILNVTTGRFFRVNTTLDGSQTLVIDSDARTAKVNGTSVLANRGDGSNWIFAEPGSNTFLLTGDDYDADNPTKAGASVSFSSAWL